MALRFYAAAAQI